jgi:hypothetical protein
MAEDDGLRDTPGLGKSQTDADHLTAGFRNLSRHIRTDSEDHCFGWSTTRTRMSEFQIVQGAFPRLQFMQCLRAVPRARLRNRPNWRISGEALLMHRHEGSPGVCSGCGQITNIQLTITCKGQNRKELENRDEKRFRTLWQPFRCEVSQTSSQIFSTCSIPLSGIVNWRCALTIAGSICASRWRPSIDREIVSRFGAFGFLSPAMALPQIPGFDPGTGGRGC